MKKIPIKLEIYTRHNLPKDSVDEIKKSEMKATKCAFVAESVFLVLSEILDNAAMDGGKFQKTDNESMFFALSYLAEVGQSAASGCYQEIDRLKSLADDSSIFDKFDKKEFE